MRTLNPTLGVNTFDGLPAGAGQMTLTGTISKILFLLSIVIVAAAWAWNSYPHDGSITEAQYKVYYMAIPGLAAFVLALVISFFKRLARLLSVAYAVLEGISLGAISVLSDIKTPGIMAFASLLCFGTLLGLLLAYQSGKIRVTENFKLGVMAATFGVLLAFFVDSMVMLATGDRAFFSFHSWSSAIFSGIVVVIAALNLVLDFDFIESGVRKGAPRYMEWYAAFGIMVTMVWLYLSLLKLLKELSSSK